MNEFQRQFARETTLGVALLSLSFIVTACYALTTIDWGEPWTYLIYFFAFGGFGIMADIWFNIFLAWMDKQ